MGSVAIGRFRRVLLGLLATAVAPAGVSGLLYGGGADQLARQLLGGGAVMVFAFGMSYVLAKVLDATMGFRVEEEHEVSGIDLVVHAETAYDLHATAGTRTGGTVLGSSTLRITERNLEA